MADPDGDRTSDDAAAEVDATVGTACVSVDVDLATPDTEEAAFDDEPTAGSRES